MAAMLDMVNESREEHIITVEDPIEVVHKSKSCLVNQRQVGPHTETFARALRAALREDPDIIGIGELRDLETISLALTAAETGHFVLATLHTNSAMRTINRLIGAFPNRQHPLEIEFGARLPGVLDDIVGGLGIIRPCPRQCRLGRVVDIHLLGTTTAGHDRRVDEEPLE